MKHSLAALEAAAGGPISFTDSVTNLGHAALMGAILMCITAWATYQTLSSGVSKGSDDDEDDDIDSPSELILSSANVMFICFGMAAVMVLVNNNLARAFTIGATIAMIRFKIKLNSKAINMGLFYGALVGMSCGVDQSKLGYVAVFFFGMFQLCVVGIAKLGDRAKVALNRKKIANRKSAADAMIITKAMTQPRPGAAPNATQAPLD